MLHCLAIREFGQRAGLNSAAAPTECASLLAEDVLALHFRCGKKQRWQDLMQDSVCSSRQRRQTNQPLALDVGRSPNASFTPHSRLVETLDSCQYLAVIEIAATANIEIHELRVRPTKSPMT